MTRIRHSSRLLAVGLASALLAGCGGADTGEPIPADQAETLEGQLDAIEAAVGDGLCDEIDDRVSAARRTVASLERDDVGQDVQDALNDGIVRLRRLAEGECRPEEEEEVETTPTSPVEPAPPPPDTDPPPTDTAPPAPQPEPEDEGDEDDDSVAPGEGGGVQTPGQGRGGSG